MYKLQSHNLFRKSADSLSKYPHEIWQLPYRRHISLSVPMCSPRFLSLPSAGFSVSFGINHRRLNFATPGMWFPSHTFCTCLSEMPHFLLLPGQNYTLTSLSTLPLISISTIIYVQPNNFNLLFENKENSFGWLTALCRHIQEERWTVKCNRVNEYGKKTSTTIWL